MSNEAFGRALVFENTLTTPLQLTVTGATGNGVPVVVTVASTTGVLLGDYVAVHGMAGNTAANCSTGGNTDGLTGSSTGLIVAAITSTTLTFLMNGNGTWTSGGTVTLISR